MSRFKAYIRNNNIKELDALRLEDIKSFYDEEYKTILLFTCRLGSYDSLVFICERINQLDTALLYHLAQVRDKYDRSILDCAAIHGEVQKCDYLINKFDISRTRDELGYSALTHALSREKIDVFYYLAAKNFEFNEKEQSKVNKFPDTKKYLNSPIGFLRSVQTQNVPLFSWIFKYVKGLGTVEQKAYCVIIDNKGRNALMIAAQFNEFILFNVLLGLPFDLSLKDFNGATLSHYMQEGYFECKKNIERFLETVTENSSRQKGYWPKTFSEQACFKRSFYLERERQLLRQIATQLFFSFKKYLTLRSDKLIELQIMHLYSDRKHQLFIACNQSSIASELNKFLPNMHWLHEYLISPHQQTSDREGVTRSSRYAKKLDERIYKNRSFFQVEIESDDLMHSKDISDLLNGDKPIRTLLHSPDVSTNKDNITNALMSDTAIFVINSQGSLNKTRHAEEFLVDIVDVAKMRDASTYSCIAGKKRPCMTCWGRMSASDINKFGAHPGRIWKGSFKNQKSKHALHTAFCLLSKPAYYTEKLLVNGKKQKFTDYDSESDSDYTLN